MITDRKSFLPRSGKRESWKGGGNVVVERKQDLPKGGGGGEKGSGRRHTEPVVRFNPNVKHKKSICLINRCEQRIVVSVLFCLYTFGSARFEC